MSSTTAVINLQYHREINTDPERKIMFAVKKGGHSELNRYYGMMEVDFDRKELLPRLSLHKALFSGTAELLVAYDDESNITLGYAVIFPKNIYKYVLLKYIAILPWYRGKGIGMEFMRYIGKEYASSQGIIAEIPVFEDNEPEQIRRLMKFFSRFGYVEVKSDYRIGGAEVRLLCRPLKGTGQITPVYHRILGDFYGRVLPADSRMVDFRRVTEEEK